MAFVRSPKYPNANFLWNIPWTINTKFIRSAVTSTFISFCLMVSEIVSNKCNSLWAKVIKSMNIWDLVASGLATQKQVISGSNRLSLKSSIKISDEYLLMAPYWTTVLYFWIFASVIPSHLSSPSILISIWVGSSSSFSFSSFFTSATFPWVQV